MGSGKRNKQRYGNVPCKDKAEAPNSVQSVHIESNVRDTAGGDSLSDASEPREDGMLFCGNNDSKDSGSSTAEGSFVDNVMENSGSSDVVPGWSLGALAFYVLEAANKWVEQQKPRLTTFATVICDTQNYVCAKTKIACPIIWTWILHFGKLMFLISMVWLDCSLRGLDSLLRLGTTSFCTVIWCSILSVTAMIGITKMLIIMVIAALVAIFISFALAILIIAILGTVILWLYGSFWTTGLVILIGGITFALRLERVALLVTTLYSMHCARSYIGWLGLFLGLNLSFISSDVLIHFLKDNINEHRSNSPPEQARQSQSRAGHFYGEPFYASPADDAFQSSSGGSADRSTGVPSTSGAETSEDEVVRLLQCNDHYSALGLTRFENIDVSLLKREYRKKAMLVHPDKNMGNEKAAEAFQKLQNAYEVLLDSLKRKTYDDELRREELLNYFRRFQNSSQKNGRHGIFSPGFTHSVDEDEGPHGESRKIACKKCSDFHIWTRIERSKSLARWCQDCNDFHQAKDGDGWVEQSSQPFLFGLLQKVDPPHAYVCAESRIYDATEWFICQGMSCPPNTHKPSFHVNTSIASKHNSSKGSSSTQRGGGERSTPNMDEPMTEEEFFEWLQNAMQSGMFEANSTSNESPTAKTASCSKSGLKKKRKGKKQW